MEDKRTPSEPGSIDNPLGPPEEERKRKWTKMLEACSPKSLEFIAEVSHDLLPALKLSEKLGTQANSLMMSLKMLEKQQKEGNAEHAKLIIERVHPILTLRELLDVYITNSCEKHLDDLENS